jgi:hypothetical protein
MEDDLMRDVKTHVQTDGSMAAYNALLKDIVNDFSKLTRYEQQRLVQDISLKLVQEGLMPQLSIGYAAENFSQLQDGDHHITKDSIDNDIKRENASDDPLKSLYLLMDAQLKTQLETGFTHHDDFLIGGLGLGHESHYVTRDDLRDVYDGKK